MPEDLLTPILTDGSRRIHYFNGRVLTAEDLKVEQETLRRRDDRLGRALGEGVVEGLEVYRADTTQPAVTISAGLAITREGQVLALAQDVTVNVVPEAEATDPGDALFVPCPGASTGTAIPVGTGAYVLLAAPAAGTDGLAPSVGLSDDGVARACQTRFVVEGIQFRLVELDLESDALVPEALAGPLRELAALSNPNGSQRARLRSLLAHWCLGTVEIAGFPEAHFGGSAPPDAYVYGPLDRLRALDPEDADRVADCEVPLALLFWQGGGIALVDRWAVRRRPMPPSVSAPWAPHVGVRRMAEAEAAFLQFQEHVAELAAAGVNLRTETASTFVAFLPSGGYVPASEGSPGEFFGDFTTYHEVLDEALVRQHLFASWLEEPIALLTEARPPLVLYHHPDYVLFRRGSDRVEVEAEEEGDTSEPTTPQRGTIEVGVQGTEEALRAFAAAYRQKTVRLEVRHVATGAAYPLSLPGDAGIRTSGSGFEGFTFGRYSASPRVRFTTGRIPTGSYRVSLIVNRTSGREQRVTLAANETERVTFELGRGGTKGEPPLRKPDRAHAVGAELDDRFGKYVIVEEHLGPVWPPPEPEPWWERVDPLDDPAPDVREWAATWGGWIQKTYPDAAVDPEAPLLYVNPAHDPEAVAEAPYAYVVFGERGAYVPLLLTPAARTLERTVSTEGTLLPEGELGRRVEGTALGHLDAVAAGWTGLVAETLGVSAATAAGLIADARAGVDDRKGSLRVFSGVDAGLEQTLVEAGFEDAVALANADVNALAEALGAQGVPLTLARLLVDEARQVVPAGAWDLGRSGLGLGAGALAGLGEIGIRTVGDFQQAAADAGGRERLRSALGVTDETLGVMEGALDQVYTGARLDLLGGAQAKAPLTRLAGVDAEAAAALERAGLRSIGDLAGADRTAVVEVLGEAAAEVALTGAREAMPVTAVAEVPPSTARALRRQGIRTLGALAAADPDAVAEAFGDRAAAETAIGGAQHRLRR